MSSTISDVTSFVAHPARQRRRAKVRRKGPKNQKQPARSESPVRPVGTFVKTTPKILHKGNSRRWTKCASRSPGLWAPVSSGKLVAARVDPSSARQWVLINLFIWYIQTSYTISYYKQVCKFEVRSCSNQIYFLKLWTNFSCLVSLQRHCINLKREKKLIV